MAKSCAPVRRSRMPCIPRVSAAVLPSNTAMSAAGGTQEKGLSGDQVATANGVLTIHPVADLKQAMPTR